MFRGSKNDTSSFDAHQYRKDCWLAGCLMAITSVGMAVAATIDDGKPKSFDTICCTSVLLFAFSYVGFAYSYVGFMYTFQTYAMMEEHAREHDVSPRLRS